MRRTFWYALGIAAVLGTLTGATPAFADYGAIAYDRNNCAWGRSWHHQSPGRAVEAALSECGHRGCRVMLEVGPGECGALAATDNCRGFGWAKRYSRREAQEAAMNSCRGYNGAGVCSVRVVDCNR